MQLRIDGLIPEVIRQQIKELEIEYDTKDIDKSIEAQELTIKNYVLLHGNSVKSDRLTAVYIKPGYTANIDKLLGMAVTLPQLMTCLKSKNPYVQIKTNKKENNELLAK